MNPKKQVKNIDKSKLNVGVELECFLVHSDSLKEISRAESQTVFQALIDKFNWQAVMAPHINEIHGAEKKIDGRAVLIKIDLAYPIFEITNTEPAPDLETLETVNSQALKELRAVLKELGFTIWPHGVAPASSNLHNMPFKHGEEIIDDLIYKPMGRLESLPRFCHMTSEQVSLDIPLDKLIPTVNALFKNLGSIINKFANSPLLVKGKKYKEGRYYFWNDIEPILKTIRFTRHEPFFPEKPFASIQDYYNRMWTGEFIFILRNGKTHTFKDLSVSAHRFFKEQKGIAITPEGEELEVQLEKEDINTVLATGWLDFKPHFDLDDNFTLEDFLGFYERKDLDGFFKKFSKHNYLEIRPCSPHYENNAMDIPKYFYNIFQNLDEYIEKAEKINWEKAREAREKSLLA